MKPSGICGKQSARKHRKAGHYVVKMWGIPNKWEWLKSDQHGWGITGRRPTVAIIDDIVCCTPGVLAQLIGKQV